MRTPAVLLKYLAKALANAVPGGPVVVDLVVDVLPEACKDAWEWWSKDRNAAERKADVEAVAQAGEEQVKQEVAEFVLEFASDKPTETQEMISILLTKVPSELRRSLRQPSEPTSNILANLPQSIRATGEDWVRTKLESPGFTVDVKTIDNLRIVIADRQDIGHLGILIRSRERRQGDVETCINVGEDSLLTKFEQVCQRERLVPWLAFYVHASGDIYMTSLDNYRSKYRGTRKIPAWKMARKDKDRYRQDEHVMHINVSGMTESPPNWFTDVPPLREDEGGIVRVGNSRISLDLLVEQFENGMTPEDMVRAYDTLVLADVHAVIAYYLRHRDEVRAYLKRRAEEAGTMRAQIEAERPRISRGELLARRAREKADASAGQ